MKKQSLRSQLTLTIATVVLLTVALISLLSNFIINQKFKDYIANQQNYKIQEIVSSLSQQYNQKSQQWNEDFIHTIGMYVLYDGYIIQVYDKSGNVIWDAKSHDMSLCNQVMTDIIERMAEKYPEVNGQFTSKDYFLEQNGKTIGSVAISYYGPYFLNENDYQFLRTLNYILVGIGIFSLIISLYIGWLMSLRISRPISKTIDSVREISEGNYNIKLEENTNTNELHALVSSVNHLADSINEQENLRKQLTADVAHELRTPLTTVGTHLEAMIEGIWTPSVERLQSCHEEIQRISKLVKDMENLAKVENENRILNKTSFDLLEMVRLISKNFELEIKHKHLTLQIEGDNVIFTADKDKISQVIVNLLSNAIKYTPESGQIHFFVEESENEVQLSIKDNGIGISKEDLPFIFERFFRADKSRNRKTGGAGIGLAITKSIINAHQGIIEVDSEPNQGTCFRVRFPK